MNFSNTYIIDLQYLCGNSNNEFFVKELAICQLGTLEAESYHFKPPYSTKHLINQNSEKINNFMMKKFNVKWDEGNISYLQLDKIFSKLNDKVILVKGDEKKRIVEQYVSSHSKVENLEHLYPDIPNLRSLPNFKMSCVKHFENYKSLCAQRNVMNLMMYVLSK